MPKRPYPDDKEPDDVTKLVKNSLDSDEDDNDSDDGKYCLKDDDIEGQEDGVVGLEEGITITPFNMKEELEEGHFDNDGMYHWKKEKVARDNWLENIDWVKVKEAEPSTAGKSGSDDEDMPEAVDTIKLYREILTYLQPKESIAQALKRLGGGKSLSASEKLKRKKAGLPFNSSGDSEKVSTLTGLANAILTHSGNMDIYQETYEQISQQIDASSKTKAVVEPELDMYADDFGDKEKERLADGPADTDDPVEQPKNAEIMWEYKKSENDAEILGPFTSAQMEKRANNGDFGSGVLVRKCGTEQFYTSSRIDFDLYI